MKRASKDQKEDSMRHIFKFATMAFAMAVAATTIVAGCASAPPLRTEASASGIRAAEEVGADKVPQASLHLQLAKEELENAKALAAKNQKGMAVSMLSRSEADAELAVALSREDAEKAEARAAVDRVRQFRQENK
jgi:hypothetical protein